MRAKSKHIREKTEQNKHGETMQLKMKNYPRVKNKHSNSHANPSQSSLRCKSFHHLLLWRLCCSRPGWQNTKEKKLCLTETQQSQLTPRSDEAIRLEEWFPLQSWGDRRINLGLNYLPFIEGKKEFVIWVSNGAVCQQFSHFKHCLSC